LRQRRLLRSNRQLLEQLGRDTEIVGSGTRTEQLREMIRAAAASDAPVLICGEPGSGRENVARRIHASGRRPDGPFVEIPCGALDGDAARGALGLDETRGGRLALAAGGTLFLEDVDRLETGLQRRIAAALLAGTRQGSDIRLLASAPAEAAGVEDDLRRLLDVIRVDVPRLADRREDIPLLVERLMHDLSREYGKTPKRLEQRALAALRAHPWPGNLRQLRNLVERLVLTASGDTITVADLPADYGGEGDSTVDLYGDFGGLSEGVGVFVQYHVRRAMLQAGGDAKEAAKMLGITKRELLEKLEED
jgi:DNA-binding NtrC family response regulator